MEQKPNHILYCEKLFQRAAEQYVVHHKKEVAEFYLEELSTKLGYTIIFKWLLDIICDDLQMATGSDKSIHLMSLPRKGEHFTILRRGRASMDLPGVFPIQYVNCEITRSEMGFIEVMPSIIYDRKAIAYPLQAITPFIIDYYDLPNWNFNK